MATLAQIAAAVDSALAELRAIDARYANNRTTVLSASAKRIGSSLDVLEGVDVSWLVLGRAPVVTTPVVTDLQAPYAPTGLTVTPAVGQLTVALDPSMDLHDGVMAGSGVATYIVNVGGTDQASISAGANANILPQPTLWNIGSMASPTLSQSGTTYTLAGRSNGYDSTADQMPLLGWEITGTTWDLYVDISAFTGTGYEYANAALMWRETTAAGCEAALGAKFGAVGHWLSALSSGSEVKVRTTTGGGYTSLGFIAGSGAPKQVHISRRGNVFAYERSVDGANWTNRIEQTISVSSTLCIGATVSDIQNLPALTGLLTAQFHQLGYTTNARLSATYANVSTSPVPVYVRAIDVDGNVSGNSATVSATPLIYVAPGGAYTKFAPGIWPMQNAMLMRVHQTDYWNQLEQWVHDYVQVPALVKGGMLIGSWGSLEGSMGDYSHCDAIIDKLIEVFSAAGKPFMIHMWPRKFQSSSDTLYGSSPGIPYIPQYIIDLPNGSINVPAVRTANLANEYINGRYIALYKHIGDKYDGNKWFHGIETEETADGAGVYPAGARKIQWYRFLDEVKPHFPHTSVRISCNWWGDGWGQTAVDEMRAFIEYLYVKGYDIGGPDMYCFNNGQYPSFGDGIIRGMGYVVDSLGKYGFNPDFGTKDYRGLMQIAYHNEFINNATREVLVDYSKNKVKNTHLVWGSSLEGESGDGGTATQYTTFLGSNGAYNYMASLPQPITATACPVNANGLCSTNWGSG